MKRFLTVSVSIGFMGIFILICMALAGGRTEQLSGADIAMGTVITQRIYVDRPFFHLQSDDTETETQHILSQIEALERELLSRRISQSETAQINAAGRGQVSPEMGALVEKCLEISQASDGAFDITLGNLVMLWDIDRLAAEPETLQGAESGEFPPKKEDIEAARAASGYDKLLVSDCEIILSDGIALDLGAVGKGVAMNRVREYLEGEKEITGAVISLGGSILTYGSKPDKTPWRISIADPFDTGQSIGTLSLEGQWCVSTSGDYERYVYSDGVRYHHILDPGTGYPAVSGVHSVTILTKDGFLSDALSTACFILGEEKGMALAEEYGAEALFVDEEGNLSMTEGMRQYFNESDR